MYPTGNHVHAAGRLAGRRRASSRGCRRNAHDRDGVAILRLAAGVSSADGRLRQQHVRAVLAQLVDDPQPRRAACVRGVQRLPPVSAGLCLCGRSGEHFSGVARCPHHGVVRARNIPGDADDGRRRAGYCAGVAAAWRVARRHLYPASRHYHSRTWILPLGAYMSHSLLAGHPV